ARDVVLAALNPKDGQLRALAGDAAVAYELGCRSLWSAHPTPGHRAWTCSATCLLAIMMGPDQGAARAHSRRYGSDCTEVDAAADTANAEGVRTGGARRR
ncbi:hypothetical protein, partial [Xanthomonas oryzae]|uniref:hypothetical protein n=1 Tax=Xanthomonas oryzae TaxID=347 RepID=UPI001ED981F7